MKKDQVLPVSSWVLYDFANTIFYAIVVTRYLPVQLERLTGKHTTLLLGFFPAMFAAAFLAPWLGRWVGSRGASKKTVGLLTVAACVFTAGLGITDEVWVLLVCFAFAQVLYQLALVPYNNLLPSVASERRMGIVSGLGVGIGYGGVIVSLYIAHHVISAFSDGSSESPAYIVAAILFFLFTLPLLFWVKETVTVDSEKTVSFREVAKVLKDRICRRFVIGNFLCADALNALLAMISVYLVNELAFDGDRLLDLFIVLNVSALISGILLGFLTDRFSASRIMPLAAASLAACVAVAHFSHDAEIAFWSIVLLGGPGVAGIWVAGRKWVVQLAPKGDVGTLFGFYGMSNKLSLLNMVLFTLLADLTGGYTASVGVLIVSLVAGISVLLTIPAAREGS